MKTLLSHLWVCMAAQTNWSRIKKGTYLWVLVVLNFLKFYVLYAFFQLLGLLCVVSSLDVFIGHMEFLKAGIVVLLIRC